MIHGAGEPARALRARLFNGPLNVRPSAAAIEALRKHLETFRAMRIEAEKLADMPDSNYEPAEDDSGHDWVMSLPELAEFMKLDTTMRLHDGHPIEIARSCRAQLNLARTTHRELTVWAMQISPMTMAAALDVMERVLAQQQELPAGDLQALQQTLQREIDEPYAAWWLRGERARMVDVLEAVHSGRIQPFMRLPRPVGWQGWIKSWVPGNSAIHSGSIVRVCNAVVAASKLPVEQQIDEFERIRRYCEQEPPDVALTKYNCTLVAEHVPNWAMLRCAMAAVAAERYRQARQRWPASLDTLVEAGYLQAVPVDPYDGKPLRYRALGDGILIYSTGADRVDDGGVVNRANPTATGADIGFQLWDPDQRGRPHTH